MLSSFESPNIVSFFENDELRLLTMRRGRANYSAWIEKWPDGWVAQYVSDSGAGGIIADQLPTHLNALAYVVRFLKANGGTSIIRRELLYGKA